jgi:VCBS repeat protein
MRNHLPSLSPLRPLSRRPAAPPRPGRHPAAPPRLGRRLVAAAVGVAAALLFAPAGALAAPYFQNAPGALPSPQPCGGTGCYTNFLVLADLEGDGDLDVLLANGGGFYTAGQAEPSTVYLNDGNGSFVDANGPVFGGATSRLRQVAVADVDGDGDLDVYTPGGYGQDRDKLFVQTAPGVFQNQAGTRLPPGLASRAGAAHFGDIDGDGDVDLAVTDWGDEPFGSPSQVKLFRNDGAGVFTAAPPGSVPPPLSVGDASTPIDVDLQDVDNDFDLDLIVNNRNGRSRLFVNDGAGVFADQTANHPPKQGPYAYNTEACDVDGDGDLDLLIDNAAGNLSNHRSQVLINDGAGKFTDETLLRIASEPDTDDNAVKCADVDDDGDYDLVVASLGHSSEKLLRNDGTGKFAFVPDAFPGVNDATLSVDIGDLNGDGIYDVVSGQGEFGSFLERVYFGAGASAPDTRRPTFRAIETPDAQALAPIVMRLAITDGHTSETGQHLADVSVVFTVVGGASDVVRARFVGGDLYRVELPPQPAGTHLSVVPFATDRAGNVATSSALEIVVDGGTGGAGGGAGSGGAGGEGGAGGVGGGSGGASGAGGVGGAGGISGAGGVGGSQGGANGSGGDAGTSGSGTGGSGTGGSGTGGSGTSGSSTGGTGGQGGSVGGSGTGGQAGSTGGESGNAGAGGEGTAGSDPQGGSAGVGNAGEAGAGGGLEAGAAGAGEAGAGEGGTAGVSSAGAAGSPAGGQGGGATSGTGGVAGAAQAGRAGAPGTSGVGGANGNGGPTMPPSDDDDDGCGCAVPGRSEAPVPGAGLLLAAVAALGRRQRSRRSAP